MKLPIVCVDDVHFFVPHPTAVGVMVVTVRQGYPFYVACRPTHPDTVMTLWKGQSSSPGSTQIHIGHDVSYHPHTGFYIRTPNVYYNGMFHCRAELNSTHEFYNLWMLFRSEY